MKSVAILLDGGFVRHKLYRALARQHATSKDIMRFVQACLRPADEELFRIYYYGWALKRKATQELLKAARAIRPDDLEPDLGQKRVDMMIGLDIAWMASKRIVDRLLLVTGDTDFVPAMKFARREGVQVVVITVDNRLRQELREHADEVRLVRFPPAGTGTPAASTGPMP